VFSSNEERAVEALKSAKQFLKGAEEKAIAIEKFRDGFFPYIGGQIKEYFETLKSDSVRISSSRITAKIFTRITVSYQI